MILAMGSCRITQVFYKTSPDIVCPTIGNTFSSADTLQAIKHINGEIIIPNELENYYNGISRQTRNSKIDFNTINTVIIEICTLKNYIYKEFILNIGYSAKDIVHNVETLPGVILIKETYQDIINNLAAIKKYFINQQLIIVAMNNIKNVPSRYLIAAAVSQFCKDNKNCKFLDPTLFLYDSMKTGKPVFHTKNESDYYHYKEEFYPSVKDWILSSI